MKIKDEKERNGKNSKGTRTMHAKRWHIKKETIDFSI